jgi:hypothetical protein
MITREQYLEALDIVESYHQQNRQHKVEQKKKNWDDLQVGDMIKFTKSLSKHILVDKEYEVTHVDKDFKVSHFAFFQFICENDTEKIMRKHPAGYRLRYA